MQESESFADKNVLKMCKIKINDETHKLEWHDWDTSWEIALERGKLEYESRICKLCGNPKKLVKNVENGFIDVHAICFRHIGYNRIDQSDLLVEKLFNELPKLIAKHGNIQSVKEFQRNVILGVIIRLFDASSQDKFVSQRLIIHKRNKYLKPCPFDPAIEEDIINQDNMKTFTKWCNKTGKCIIF